MNVLTLTLVGTKTKPTFVIKIFRKMNQYKCKKTMKIQLPVVIVTIIISFIFQEIKAQEKVRNFSFTPISESQFRKYSKENYNALYLSQIEDSSKLEKSFKSIERTYSEDEKELAQSELCNSPRGITTFKAYYPNLNLYLFNILDYHYDKACFIYENTNTMASGNQRFRGSYGVMSKDGLWVGLERDDCDNYLQIEVCKISELGVWQILKFDFTYIDINTKEENSIFWATKNMIYIATCEYDKDIYSYYAIEFEY